MRRFFIALLCCMMLITAVSAAGTVSGFESDTVVRSDGTCQVTLNFTLTLDIVPEELYFPLPANARNVSLNGGVAPTKLMGNVRNVDLKRTVHYPGTYTFVIHYDLPDSITQTKNGTLQLDLQILSGFAFPMSDMEFSVTLPGEVDVRPQFVSTYHQEGVDTIMECTQFDTTLSYRFLQTLMDHESLSMSLHVPEELFPQPMTKKWSLSNDDVALFGFALLALLYWLLTMRALPPARARRTQAPEGLSAGMVGCCLTATGIDFPALILSWAQMGYLQIELTGKRVILHKRMDMGNERSELEEKLFRALFGRRTRLDTSGYHFARLSKKVSATVYGRREFFRRRSGNRMVYRILCAGMGVCAGIALALSFVSDTAWQIVLSMVLGCVGAGLSLLIHIGTATTHLRRKLPLWTALLGSAVWLLLGIWAQDATVAILMICLQWLAGFAGAYGGRRTEPGRLTMAELFGLRRHLQRVSGNQLQQILQGNPDYYFNMAPYAAALGVDKAFARQQGKRKLPYCPYLICPGYGPRTAREWNALLQSALQTMDDHPQRTFLDKFTGK